jgi:hypothetical protein
MAIVYKTAQVSATGWTDFGRSLRLSLCASCAIALASKVCPGLDPGWMAVRMMNAHQNGALVRK